LQYLRSIDFDSAEFGGGDGYKGKILYRGETCLLIATEVPPGALGPKNHVHPSDQLYYVVEGELTVTLGSDEHTVPAGSAVFIPAGVPHHNRNDGSVPEFHLEILAPGSVGVRPLLEPTDSTDAHGLPYAVVAPDEASIRRFEGGMTATPLLGRVQGSNHAHIYQADLPVGAAGPGLHVHAFDQFYLVLDGRLGVQVALTEFTVGPRQIAVLPAGVPHRQWNVGEGSERHLAVLTPPPEQPSSEDAPWDIGVELQSAPQNGARLISGVPAR